VSWPKGVPRTVGLAAAARKNRGKYIYRRRPSVKLRALREFRRVSVAELAVRLGISEAEVRSVEAGEFIFYRDLRERWRKELDPDTEFPQTWQPPFGKLRQRAGLTALQVSALLGVSRLSVHFWEKRNVVPRKHEKAYLHLCETFAAPGNLREWRKREHVLQEDAAVLFGVSHPTYAKMERNPGELSASEYDLMSRVLRMSGIEARRVAKALRGGA